MYHMNNKYISRNYSKLHLTWLWTGIQKYNLKQELTHDLLGQIELTPPNLNLNTLIVAEICSVCSFYYKQTNIELTA